MQRPSGLRTHRAWARQVLDSLGVDEHSACVPGGRRRGESNEAKHIRCRPSLRGTRPPAATASRAAAKALEKARPPRRGDAWAGRETSSSAPVMARCSPGVLCCRFMTSFRSCRRLHGACTPDFCLTVRMRRKRKELRSWLGTLPPGSATAIAFRWPGCARGGQRQTHLP